MKKRLTKVFGVLAALMLIVQVGLPVTNAYAYTKAAYNYKNSRYYVDDSEKHTQDNSITLYLLFPSDSFLEGDIYYDFLCFSDNFPEGTWYAENGFEMLRYHAKLDTAKVVAENVGEGQVLSFKFNVENGTYAFSTNDYAFQICALTHDKKSPLEHKRVYGDDSTVWYDKVTLTNQHMDVFAIMGGEEFIEDNMNAMISYANGFRESELTTSQKENNLRDALSDVVSDDTDKDDISMLVDELMSDDSTTDGTESATVSENKKLDVNNTSTNSDGVNITTKSGNNSDDENTQAQSESGVKRYIIIGAGVLLIIIIIIIKKKKK